MLDLQKLELQVVIKHRVGCWGLSLSPLQEQKALLIHESSLQPLHFIS